MRIEKVTVTILKRRVERTFGSSLTNYDVGGYLLTQIHSDNGYIGNAITYFGLIESGMSTVKKIIDSEITPVLIGQDPHFVRLIRKMVHDRLSYYGTSGVAAMAISAVDICCWDLIGKSANTPVAMVLGARRTSVPAYAMVGWYYEDGLKGLVNACVNAAEEGFSAVKIKVGRGDLKDDMSRINAVRKALGDDYRIMIDANCAFDEFEALRRGYAYQDADIFWYEEPLPPYLMESYKRLREKLRIPIAGGENFFMKHQFYDAIRGGCLDIVQPDNRRAGGVTEWLEIAAISDVAGLKLASHLGGPGNVNVMCSIENTIYLECEGIKHDNEMLMHPLVLKNGEVQMPSVPGMGNELKEEFIEKYKID